MWDRLVRQRVIVRIGVFLHRGRNITQQTSGKSELWRPGFARWRLLPIIPTQSGLHPKGWTQPMGCFMAKYTVQVKLLAVQDYCS
ncbi:MULTISPECIES: hypothetical protein, partial [unclassified Pseudomonas]|uniref:hypothetical protein n=1 Tax=unclassified Pseudomonas TaxID=196821 RepID=UPI00320B92C1